VEKWISSEIQESIAVKPGITGLWQVTARRHPPFEKNMRLDLEYIESWNLMLDFKMMVRTLGVILKGDGACAVFCKSCE
jgi:lipopolysaccharide/colanic/teichoic acid biosynthesis glycosyltransferase